MTREDNQLALHCFFRNNPLQWGYRKRIIGILLEYASFKKTSQGLADQVRTIIKKGWFSDLEIREIHQKINNEQDNNTVPDTSRIIKQKQPIKMNCQLRKIEKWHNQITHNQTTKKKNYHKNKR